MKHRSLRSLAIASALLFSSAVGIHAQDAAPVQGGELKVASGTLPPLLDPMSYNSPPNNWVQDLIFSTVTRIESYGDTVKVAPQVAASWKQVSDLVWEFEIAPGLAFSNGEPINAETVAWSAAFLIDPANAKSQANRLTASITAVEAVGELTVRVTTSYPDQTVPSRMGALAVIPPKAVKEAGDAFYTAPVGSGPFLVEEFLPEERLVLVRNPNVVGLEPALLDRVVIEVIPQAGSRVAALQSGDVDVIRAVPTEQIEFLESAGFKVVSKVEAGIYQLTAWQPEGPLNDVRVRHALSTAIDRNALNEVILSGRGEVATQPVNPGYPGYCAEVGPYVYDPEAARQMIVDAGYGDGFTVKLQSSQGYIANDTVLAEAIAGMLSEIGVTVDLEIQEFGSFLAAFRDPALRPGLFAPRFANNPFLDSELALSFYLSTYKNHASGWVNADYDAAWQAARTATSAEARDAAFCDAVKILRDEEPAIFLVHMPDVWAISPAVATLPLEATGVPVFEKAGLAAAR